MKMWDKEKFAHGSPGFLRQSLGASDTVDAVQAQFAWIASLPIAVGVFRQTLDGIEHISSNSLFSALLFEANREPGLDLAGLSQRIARMTEENRESHFEYWRSPDPISRRELEISIARFGEARDQYMVSLVDRTAEAVSRNNLRREMLSDSLTGFFNRSGFEEEVERRIKNICKDPETPYTNYAILLIDLARFSRVNESVGALAGDELIITVARRLNSRIRSNEILCRLGGNE
jgi:predicted signal transduction protein with EAL and GGDEF domain